jgi:hypothetical protein
METYKVSNAIRVAPEFSDNTAAWGINVDDSNAEIVAGYC